MAESFFAKITPVTRPDGGPVDPDYGVQPPVDPGYGRPILPPLPGIWPPPGQVAPPINLPPVGVMPPIYIDATPELPIALPPGIYPPLPPELGTGKVAVLVAVVGLTSNDIWHGYRWAIVDKPGGVVNPMPPLEPPTPQPKR